MAGIHEDVFDHMEDTQARAILAMQRIGVVVADAARSAKGTALRPALDSWKASVNNKVGAVLRTRVAKVQGWPTQRAIAAVARAAQKGAQIQGKIDALSNRGQSIPPAAESKLDQAVDSMWDLAEWLRDRLDEERSLGMSARRR